MLFGEIVEPSTRALIDDELVEYPEYTEPTLEWENFQGVPPQIHSLIIVETAKIIKLFKTFVYGSTKPIMKLKNGALDVYQEPKNMFLAVYNKNKLSTGQITEALSEWIKKANNVYGVTSDAVANYQNRELQERPETLIRILGKNVKGINHKFLEPPNLVSGLSASILTYCNHMGLNATLFVVYMDNSPLDSVNTEPVRQLIESLNLEIRSRKLAPNSPTSNLYM